MFIQENLDRVHRKRILEPAMILHGSGLKTLMILSKLKKTTK